MTVSKTKKFWALIAAAAAALVVALGAEIGRAHV